jgi:hypothetical protein
MRHNLPRKEVCINPGMVHLTPGQHHQTAKQTTHEQVDDRKDHSAMIPTREAAQTRSSNRALVGSGDAGQASPFGAAADAGRWFDDLYNFVHDPATLIVAFDRVAGNLGARTPGVDGLTVTVRKLGIPHEGGIAPYRPMVLWVSSLSPCTHPAPAEKGNGVLIDPDSEDP